MTKRPNRPHHLAFAEPPPEGLTALVGGQPFTLVGVRPFTGRRGRQTFILEWRAPCADCGAPFTQTLAVSGNPNIRRRCDQHRRPGVRAVWAGERIAA